MKAFAYSVKQFEQELLKKENRDRHQLTYSSQELCLDSADLARGYQAAIVFTNDDVSKPVVNKFADIGVRYLVTRSVGTDHIDLDTAKKRSIEVKNVPAYSPEAVAEHTVALALALSRKLVPSFNDGRNFDFRIENHMGFNFFGKTLGIIGLGRIGSAVAKIFLGLGCRVEGYDPSEPALNGVKLVAFEALLQSSDIVCIHIPLNSATHHLIDHRAINMMKKGVMLINTSRGAVLNTEDVLNGLIAGKIGYLGMDVYEFEKGLFFKDHRFSTHKDPKLLMLFNLPNVLITPHQGFLTNEAVTEIAASVIHILDDWEQIS